MSRFSGAYPSDWKALAHRFKEEAGWRCVRCRHPAETPAARIPCDERCNPARLPGGLNDGKQRILTTHHLDGRKDNCAWWNCLVCCQVCHLSVQARVVMEQAWPFPHSPWFRPYVAGFLAHRHGLPDDRDSVLANLDALLALA